MEEKDLILENAENQSLLSEQDAESNSAEEVQEQPAEEVQDDTAEEVQEQPTEEVAEEVEEQPAEETAEEVAEEVEEQPVEETTEEVAEEVEEQPTEEVAEEVEEQPVEETTEEVAEEVEEQPTEETAEEVAEEVQEQPAEETTEEVAEEVQEQPTEEQVESEQAEDEDGEEEDEEDGDEEGESDAEDAENAEEAQDSEEPAKKEPFKLTLPANFEELQEKICTKRGRKLIYKPNEVIYEGSFKVLGTDKKNEEGIRVKDIIDAEIKEGLKQGYLDKFDGLKASEIKEEYENDIVYELAEQEFRKMGIIVEDGKIKVYVYDWDRKGLHHIGRIDEQEASDSIKYFEDKENYSFDICGIITGGKGKRVIKDESGKIKIVKEKGDPIGVELDITVIKRKD